MDHEPQPLRYGGGQGGLRPRERVAAGREALPGGELRFVSAYVRENMPEVGVTEHEGTYLMWLDFSCLGLGRRFV